MCAPTFVQLFCLGDSLLQIASYKQRLQNGENLQPEQVSKIGREAAVIDQLRTLEQIPGAAAARDAALAPKWLYFYVLPETHKGEWHDVFQQRLDRYEGAAQHVEEAIRCLLKTEDKGLKVEVATARVDLWNAAYKYESGTRISRAKKFAGGAWMPENKRFLVRISEAHGKELAALPCPTIKVKNVPELPLVKLQDRGVKYKYGGACSPNGFDFSFYELFCKKKLKAMDANRSDIELSLCPALLFGVQASLAPTLSPSSSFDLSALGTCFLDIIMVTLRAWASCLFGAFFFHCVCYLTRYETNSATPQPGKWQEHTSHSNPSFVKAMLFLLRNCVAHFREVKNGWQAFGVNTKVHEVLCNQVIFHL
jgi:hypothetical protein